MSIIIRVPHCQKHKSPLPCPICEMNAYLNSASEERVESMSIELLQQILDNQPPTFRIELVRHITGKRRNKISYTADLCENLICDGDECVRYTAFGGGKTLSEAAIDLHKDWTKRKTKGEA